MTRKSKVVRLVVLGGLGLMAGCNRGPVWDQNAARPKDPCEREYFDPQLCQDAVSHGGYHYGGTWYPHVYSQPYPYFYNQYSGYVNSGGRLNSVPRDYYSPSFRPPPIGGRVSVSRGGFGSSFSSGHSSSVSS